MWKFLRLILINLFICFILFFALELFIWKSNNIELSNKYSNVYGFKEIKFHPGIKFFNFNLDYFPNPIENWGRAAEGLQFKNKKPIVIFGCSFAFGFMLNKEQTVSYKLSKLSKRPVYNRSYTGWGIQHMLYQVKQEKFYNQVPEPEYVIYIYINDQLRRLFLNTFDKWNMLEEEFNLKYEEKNGKLVQIQNNNIFLNQIKRSYIFNNFHHFYISRFILKHKQKCYDLALKYFIEAKNEMHKYWKNTKYVILFYNEKVEGINSKQTDDYYKKEFKNKLLKNDFILLNADELTNKNLQSEDYNQPNNHPNEAAWDLLTPLIIKKLNL